MYLVCAAISEISLPLSRTSILAQVLGVLARSARAIRRMILPRAVGVIFGQGPLSKAREAASHRPIHIDLVAFGDQRPRLSGVGIEGLEGLAGGGIDPLAVDIGLVRLERQLYDPA